MAAASHGPAASSPVLPPDPARCLDRCPRRARGTGRRSGDRARGRGPDARGTRVRRRAAATVRHPARRAVAPKAGPPGRDRPRRGPRLPARPAPDPGGGVDSRCGSFRPGRSPGRDHRPTGAEDGRQRAELGGPSLAGRSRGCQHPTLEQRRVQPGWCWRTRFAGVSRTTPRTGGSTGSAATAGWP